MCQLLGMNCNTPTDICFSFTGFQKRGGETDVHADGWASPSSKARACACSSTRNRRHSRRLQSWCAIIRSVRSMSSHTSARRRRCGVTGEHAPVPARAVGRYWVYAHNGNLPDFQPALDGSFLRSATPTANTSSAGCCRACASVSAMPRLRAMRCSAHCTS